MASLIRYARYHRLERNQKVIHAFRAHDPRTPIGPGHDWLIAKGAEHIQQWRLGHQGCFFITDDRLAMEFRLRWG